MNRNDYSIDVEIFKVFNIIIDTIGASDKRYNRFHLMSLMEAVLIIREEKVYNQRLLLTIKEIKFKI